MTHQRWPSADTLRDYRGRWVLVLDSVVLCSADSLTEIMKCGASAGLSTTTVFRVPEDPEEEYWR